MESIKEKTWWSNRSFLPDGAQQLQEILMRPVDPNLGFCIFVGRR